MFWLQLIIDNLVDCVDMSEEEAETSLELLLRDGSEALMSAFLVLLRAKGETFEEVSTSTPTTYYSNHTD